MKFLNKKFSTEQPYNEKLLNFKGKSTIIPQRTIRTITTFLEREMLLILDENFLGKPLKSSRIRNLEHFFINSHRSICDRECPYWGKDRNSPINTDGTSLILRSTTGAEVGDYPEGDLKKKNANSFEEKDEPLSCLLK